MQIRKLKTKKGVFLSWPNMTLTNMGLKDQNWSHFLARENRRERGREEKERRRKKKKKKKRKSKQSQAPKRYGITNLVYELYYESHGFCMGF